MLIERFRQNVEVDLRDPHSTNKRLLWLRDGCFWAYTAERSLSALPWQLQVSRS